MKTQVWRKPPFSQLFKQKKLFLSKLEVEGFSTIPEISVHDYLAGRFVLKTLFASMFNDDVKLSDVNVDIRDKKPQINFRDTNYHCSISHSKRHVACSISKLNEIGIDIEELKPRSEELKRYIVGQNESLYFDTDEQFLTTRIWSIKEAAFKSDSDQILITNYAIRDKYNDVFSVQNLQTGKMIQVINQVIDNYTISYTIPSTI